MILIILNDIMFDLSMIKLVKRYLIHNLNYLNDIIFDLSINIHIKIDLVHNFNHLE